MQLFFQFDEFGLHLGEVIFEIILAASSLGGETVFGRPANFIFALAVGLALDLLYFIVERVISVLKLFAQFGEFVNFKTEDDLSTSGPAPLAVFKDPVHFFQKVFLLLAFGFREGYGV